MKKEEESPVVTDQITALIFYSILEKLQHKSDWLLLSMGDIMILFVVICVILVNET